MKTFRHSGKLGDIIYSLPAVRALGGGHYFVDYQTEHFNKPPLGKETALQMLQLLRTQEYIKAADLYEGGNIHCDLDRFRDKAIAVHAFNGIRAETGKIAAALFGDTVRELRERLVPTLEVDLPALHWECAGLPGSPDLKEPWLTGIPKKHVAEIVIGKTMRHPGTLDWACLREFSARCVFVGHEEEWSAFRKEYFDVDFYRSADLMDFASVIAGSKLFVGNQSFGLALADGMLLPRVAQLWDQSPNRMPVPNSYKVLTRDLVKAFTNP